MAGARNENKHRRRPSAAAATRPWADRRRHWTETAAAAVGGQRRTQSPKRGEIGRRSVELGILTTLNAKRFLVGDRRISQIQIIKYNLSNQIYLIESIKVIDSRMKNDGDMAPP